MSLLRLTLRLGRSGVLATLVAGCSALLPGRVPDVYRLPAVHPDAVQAAPIACAADAGTAATGPIVLRVHVTATSSALAGDRIVVMPTSDTIAAYRGARWSDPAPALLRTPINEAFAADDRFIAIANDEAALRPALEIDTQLRAFQAEYRDGKPVVHVGADVQLIDPGLHRVIATHRFDAEDVPPASDVGSVVHSFGQATGTLSTELAAWVASIAARCK